MNYISLSMYLLIGFYALVSCNNKPVTREDLPGMYERGDGHLLELKAGGQAVYSTSRNDVFRGTWNLRPTGGVFVDTCKYVNEVKTDCWGENRRVLGLPVGRDRDGNVGFIFDEYEDESYYKVSRDK